MLVLREGLTRIEDRKFYNCKQIKHVIFPERLTEIGEEAFKFCGLRSLVLPDALKKSAGTLFKIRRRPSRPSLIIGKSNGGSWNISATSGTKSARGGWIDSLVDDLNQIFVRHAGNRLAKIFYRAACKNFSRSHSSTTSIKIL